jgi:hypothetical protein
MAQVPEAQSPVFRLQWCQKPKKKKTPKKLKPKHTCLQQEISTGPNQKFQSFFPFS